MERSLAIWRRPSFWGLSLLASLLSACGGGGEAVGALPSSTGGEGPSPTLAVGLLNPISGHRLRAQGLPPKGSVPLSTEQLFGWAERTYPALFPSQGITQTYEQYTYRHYPETANYLAVADGVVYVLGPFTDQTIVRVGLAEDFHCLVVPSDCANATASALQLVLPTPDVVRVGEPFGQAPAIQLKDSRGFDVAEAGVEVSVTVSGPCQAVSGASARTDPSGRASFPALVVRGAALPRRLTFAAAGLQAAESSEVRFVWGPASAGEAVSARCFGALGNGVQDDAPAIQAALDSLTDVGGTVLLPAGTYLLGTSAGGVSRGANDQVFPNGRPIESALIVNRSKLKLQGEGSATVLKLMASKKLRVLTVNRVSDVVLRDFVVDGNRDQRDGRKPWPDADVVDGLIYGNVTTRLTMQGLEARFGLEDGLGAWLSTDTLIDGCYSHDNGLPAVGATGVSLSGGKGSIENSRIEANSSTGIWLAYGSKGSAVKVNTIRDNLGAAITMGGLAIELGKGDNQDFTVLDNWVERNGKAGFPALHILAAVNGVISRNRILDNHFTGVLFEDESLAEGAPPSTGWLLENNTIGNAAPGRPQQAGLVLKGRSAANARGNTIENNGAALAAQVQIGPAAKLNADWPVVNVVRWAPPPPGADGVAPQGNLELPKPGAVVSGQVLVGGWAFDSNALDRVEVLLDGALMGVAKRGLPRPDVASAVAGAPQDAGFEFVLDLARVLNGPHTLAVRLVDASNNEVVRSVDFTVAN